MRKLLLSALTMLLCHSALAQKVDYSYLDKNLTVEERAEILVRQMTLEEKVKQMINGAPAIDRLKVPSYDWWNEALHGVARNGKATIFPQAIGMAATFDPELIKEVADAISTEARAKYAISQEMGNHSKYTGLTFWSPTVNIFRDPRYGRGQECYGEDPLLAAKMGVAYVQGLQGNNPNQLKTAACAKHFALHSGPEEGKFTFNADVSKQDLYETYLPAFEALITEGKVEGVMTAYNMVYGKPAVVSEFLIEDILRDQWQFDGYITTDCGAIGNVVKEGGYFKNATDGAIGAVELGVNLNCGAEYNTLIKAVEEGRVSEEAITKACVQLFKTRFRLGLFDKPEDNAYNYWKDVIHCDEHVELAREVAQKSIVMLKNENNVLPLSTEVKVPYVTGPFANTNDILMGSYYGVSPQIVTILEGVADAVSYGTALNYRSGALPYSENLNPKNWAPSVAKESDVVICVVGIGADMEGEGVDAIASAHGGDRVDLQLPENQRIYIAQLLEKKRPETPFILVVASGSAVSLEGIEEHCDAILQIWYPGEQGGNAVADVLFGKVSPSGKLPLTFPVNVDQLPAYDDYSMEGRTYKYMTEDPMFTFGFGLTYTNTKFENLKLGSTKIKKGKDLEVSVDVRNMGSITGEDVVQLYICPEEVTGGIPISSLKAFQRVELTAGGSENVRFTIPAEDLMVINAKGEKEWRKGKYRVVVSNASPGSRSEELGAAATSAVITL